MHICIDNRGETVPTSKIRRKKEEVPRNPKKIVNVWESPFGKVVAGPLFMLGEHQSRENISIAGSSFFLSLSDDR